MELIEGVLKTNHSDKVEVYRKISSALLDGRIPVTKIAGFYITMAYGLQETSVLERNAACSDTIHEIATRISKLTFPNNVGRTGTLHCTEGYVLSQDFNPYTLGKSIVPLEKNLEILRLTESVTVSIIFRSKDIGSKPIEDNVEYIRHIELKSPESYFPCQTEHNLSHIFRLKPLLSNGEIKYQIESGVDVKIIQSLMNDAFPEY